MTIELIRQVTSINDVDQPYAIANHLVGEICWKVALSYGDELTLHFGEQIPYTQPSMVGKKKGSWILGTRGTAWQLDQPSGNTVRQDTETDPIAMLRREVRQIEGSILQSLKIGYPMLGLSLNFSQGSQLTITPSIHDDEFELPYWELFTPDCQVLKVGPKTSWSLTPSN